MTSPLFCHKKDELLTYLQVAVIVLLIVLLPSSCFAYDTLQHDAHLIELGIGLAAGGIGTGIYLAVHHSRTSLTGCVLQSTEAPLVTTDSGRTYELLNAPADLKQDDRLSFRGHKTKTASGHPAFRVDRISGDHGPCKKS